ncbi:MAG: DinB family protein [Halopseudomonas aestusnigri]
MSGHDYFRSNSFNNAWANYRLLKTCEQLSIEELTAKRSGSFPTILHTLNHILTVDWFYISALEGKCVGHSAFDPEIPFTVLDKLFQEQRIVDRRLITYCSQLTSCELEQSVDLIHGKRIQTERVDRTLLHLFQHQIHHRGQVHSMLSGTSMSPPQLDEFYLEDENEKASRKEDFSTLGFSETDIWK